MTVNKNLINLIFVLVCNIAFAQTSDIVLNGQKIGYYNENDIPVITTKLSRENERLLRFEYGDFIYAPTNLETNYREFSNQDDDYLSNLYQSRYSRNAPHSSFLIRDAGTIKTIAVAISGSTALVGGVIMAEAPLSGAFITLLGSIAAMTLDVIGNSKIQKAADLMIYEETKQNKRIESLERELQKNESTSN